MNNSQLAKKIEKLLILELIQEGGFNAEVVEKIVKGTDLEKEFLGEAVNNLARRIKIVEKEFGYN